ncbi:MAG: gliding motility-associated C-terminal domain-containing protein, partial [Bacteroidetes bacterium]|nr:gliding motility-associated C-terminal domain-containing protein [Bacteroidota bacterium]
IVITEPTQIVLTTAVTNVLSNGNTTGAVNLTITGGVPGYTFAWSNGATTEDLNGLAAGTYTVTVTDANACTLTTTAAVTQPAQALAATLVATNVTCNGAANGSINLTANGGTTPYTFSWSNGATTEDLSNLGPNNYSVTITDANGCTFTNAAVVTEPAILSGTIAAVNVTCYGGTNGIADLTVTGGNPNYTYLWNNFATTQDLLGVGAGNYTVIVTDTKNCQFITSVTITQPSQISITANVTNINCNGSGTGAIDITATGGTGTITYAWSNGATNEDLTNLGPGTYTVTATDANGCTATASYSITQPQPLASSGVVNNVSCNGGNNGAINFTVIGGNAPFTFVWSNGGTTEDLTGLVAGTYDVTATDANGCTATNSFTVTQPSGIVSSVVGTNVTCYGAANGAANLTVSGGVTPYSFLWSNFQASEDLNNITGGTYYVIITDGNGCTKRDSVVITEPAQLVLTSIETNVLCNGASTGDINLTATGGTGAYAFVWSNGATTEDLSGLAAGTYTVTVTDGNNCTATRTVTLTQPAAMVLNATTTNVACNGGGNGSVDITVNGGVFPYTFAWSNAATTEDVNGLSGGTVSVTVTDANGCSLTQSFNISEPSAIVTAIVGTSVTCNGAANGAANLTVGGGVAPYTYLWNNFQSTEDLSNISGGTYYVIVTDANGCTKRDSVVITEPAKLVLTSVNTNVLCNGAATGAINLTVSGGTGAYTFVWNTGANTEDISGLTAGTYGVQVTDGNGCADTLIVVITQPTAMVLNATTTNVACSGGGNGSVDITINGGVFPYTFAWSNGATTEDVNGLSGGPVSVTVTDANGCTLTQSFNITEPNPLFSVLVSNNVTCYGASNGSADLAVGGGTPPYSYLWSNFHSTEDLFNIDGGTYFVVITDANGCTKRDSIVITEPAQLVLTSVETNVLCNGATTGAINLTVTGGTGAYTFAWSNGATTEDLSGLAAGTYTVTVTDANNCTATRTVTLSQPAAMVLNATTTNVACNGGGNGSVDITVNGGVFPYTFAWSNGSTTEDVNGLSGGPVSVTVTDANGCTITQSFNITEPTAITSSVVGTNVTCYGAANGAANLTVSGGVAPYSYLWNTFQATEDLSNLSGGTYYVIVTDANGCTKRDSVIISEPTQFVLSTQVTNVLCNGDATGAIDLTVSGATPSYTFAWSNGATTEDISGLLVGTYTVTVTDANACTATISATVTSPTALVVSGVVSNVFCAGGNDGNINLSVVGGAQPYTFAWSNGAVTEDLLNLTQGTYAVTVTDLNGCTATATFNVTEPTGITSSIVGTDVACQGANNGAANLTVSGGTPPYTFFWSNFQNTEDISGLDGGIYYVIITDANGCTRRDSVYINEPSPLVLTYTSNNVSCFNANDGSIDLTVTGGIPTYTFAWSNGATTEDVSNLAGNTYSVTVTDANGCTATTTVLIINPSPLSANFVTHNPTCFLGNDGAIDLLPTGGTPNYTFNWSTGATTEDITGLVHGSYIVTITDSKGCTLVDSVNIIEPAPLVTSGFIKHVTCYGYSDGFIDITAYGGTQPYTYLWSTGQSTEDIGGRPGGNNTIIVTDYNGCTVASLYVVNEPTQLLLSVSGSNVSCFDGTNGTAVALPSGGTLPYSYLWDDFATDSARSGLTAGKHAILLTDSNGCTTVDSIILTEPTDITIAGVETNVSCASGTNGAVDITVGGGTPTYTFVWSNAATTEDITAVAAGNYAVQVTDANGCVKAATFELTQPKAINTQLLTDQPSCYSSKNGSASVIASEGVAPYNFAWNTTPAQSGNTATFLGAGTYTVTVTDANSCSVSTSVTIVQPDSIAVSTTAQASRCFNTATGAVFADVVGGEAPYIYSLNGVTQLGDTFVGLAPGSYILEVTDLNGCSGTSIFTIAEASQISVDLVSSEFTLLTGMQTQLVANSTSTTPIIAHFWNPDSVINFNDCSDPANCSTPYAAPRSTTLYTVTVMNADSCTASDTITIYVTNELSAFIPTVFTPNGDGLNDRFEFDILGAETLVVKVFDRWGGLVYSNDNQPNGITGANGWDGTRDGKPASADTYVYTIDVMYFDGNSKQVSGTVTLMK